MKKTILTMAIVSTMAMSFQANAFLAMTVGLIAPPVGIALALTGLGVAGVSIIAGYAGASWAGIGFVLGGVLLDGENGQEVNFQEVPTQKLLAIGLTLNESEAYNDNINELSTALKVVSINLTEESTLEDSKKLWQEQADILGNDAINGVRKVLAFNINNKK